MLPLLALGSSGRREGKTSHSYPGCWKIIGKKGRSHYDATGIRGESEAVEYAPLRVGERIKNAVEHPIIRPSMKAVAKTYELALRPEFEAIVTLRSHLTGKKVNRLPISTRVVKDKIIEMNHLNETLCCGCIACAFEGHKESMSRPSIACAY
jgi:aromatic ring hydroxylase